MGGRGGVPNTRGNMTTSHSVRWARARGRAWGMGGSPISGGISAQQGLMPCMLVVPGAVCSAAVFVNSSRSTRVGTVLSLSSRPRGVSVGGGAEP